MSISATQSLRAPDGLYRSFNCDSIGLSQFFPKLCDPQRPSKDHTETRLKEESAQYRTTKAAQGVVGGCIYLTE